MGFGQRGCRGLDSVVEEPARTVGAFVDSAEPVALKAGMKGCFGAVGGSRAVRV